MARVSASRALPPEFYDRDVVAVARELLGMLLIRQERGEERRIGRIVEVEAYLADGDPACHAARGETARNASMFGPPGRAYVYAIHSRWCLNAVTEPAGVPSAVLIRAVEPLAGIACMRRRRGCAQIARLTTGPAKLCEAFGVDRRLDGLDLTVGRRLWIAHDESAQGGPARIVVTPRIGIRQAAELPLRFCDARSRFLSRPLPRSLAAHSPA